jgi:cytochrome b
MMAVRTATAVARNLVWDAPVRLLHVLLAGGFAAAFAIAELSDDDGPLFSLHMVFGLFVVVMALFRIVWGFAGTRYARFSSFEWSPGALAAYFAGVLTGRGLRYVGHNPATSYATVATLFLALGIGASGILMTMGFGEELEETHEFLAFALLAVAIVHVAGVLLHALRYRDDLVLSMIDRKKTLADITDATRAAWGGGVVLAVLALGTLGLGLAGYDPASGSVVIPGLGWSVGESEDHEGEHGESADDEEEHERDEQHGHHRKKAHHNDD